MGWFVSEWFYRLHRLSNVKWDEKMIMSWTGKKWNCVLIACCKLPSRNPPRMIENQSRCPEPGLSIILYKWNAAECVSIVHARVIWSTQHSIRDSVYDDLKTVSACLLPSLHHMFTYFLDLFLSLSLSLYHASRCHLYEGVSKRFRTGSITK